MEPINEKENIAAISVELRYITDSINSLKTLYEKYELKNCNKHDYILQVINTNNGAMLEKIDRMKDSACTRDQFDQFLESNNGKLRMIDERITRSERKIDKVWQYLTIAGAVLLTIWQFGQSIILEIFKKKI